MEILGVELHQAWQHRHPLDHLPGPVLFCFVFETGLPMYLRIVGNARYSSLDPVSISCLGLLNAGIAAMCHHRDSEGPVISEGKARISLALRGEPRRKMES